jgi:hypothetical protein
VELVVVAGPQDKQLQDLIVKPAAAVADGVPAAEILTQTPAH